MTLQSCADAFKEKAEAWDDVVKEWTDALAGCRSGAVGSGSWCAGQRQLSETSRKLTFAAEGLRRLGIGGTAAGTGLNAHPEYHSADGQEVK